ncbi:MAG: hypothetical protein ACOZBZ_04225 [Patescibacteria group bacterium]
MVGIIKGDMIYPAQTSLIPVQVALVRFLEQNGLPSAFGNYPYWYLGTTPFRYLTGPILPGLCLALHRIFPAFNFFEIMFGVIGISWVFGAIGVYLLVISLANSSTSEESLPPAPRLRRAGRATVRGVLAAVFYLFGPIVPFLFRFSDGIYLIAFSFLPFVYAQYAKFLRGEKRETAVLLCLLIAFVILLDSLIIPTLLLGMAAIFLAQVGWKRVEEKLKSSLVFLFFSFLVATLWYTPSYWLTLLGAPSLGGIGVIGVIGELGKLLPSALAIGAAVFSARFFKKKDLLRDFCFYWLFIFGFLTLVRFLSDPDFWLDWVSYNLELQLGLSILGGLLIGRLLGHPNYIRMKIIRINPNILVLSVLCLLCSVFWVLVVNRYVLGTLRRDITKTVEYRIGSQLSQIAKPGERVFLSGSTAFWLNSLDFCPDRGKTQIETLKNAEKCTEIVQVRGGRDQASVDPNWRKAVWEIREGAVADDAERVLKTLKISYLVVHTEESEEFYHDFVYPEKFEEIRSLVKVYDRRGDIIYKVMNVVK